MKKAGIHQHEFCRFASEIAQPLCSGDESPADNCDQDRGDQTRPKSREAGEQEATRAGQTQEAWIDQESTEKEEAINGEYGNGRAQKCAEVVLARDPARRPIAVGVDHQRRKAEANCREIVPLCTKIVVADKHDPQVPAETLPRDGASVH